MDFAVAWRANQMLFLLLPVGFALAARIAWKYVRTGDTRLSSGQERVVLAMVALLLIFGVVRNLPGAGIAGG